MDLPRPISTRDARRFVTARDVTRIPAFAIGVVRSFLADDGLTWSSAMAFYLVLSIPPLLVAFGAVGHAIVGRDDVVSSILGQVAQVVPGEGPLIQQLAVARGREVAVAGVIALAWLLVSGSRVFGILVSSIEGMWDVPRQGTFVQRQVLRFLLLGIGGLLLVIGSVATAWLSPLGSSVAPDRTLLWLAGAQVLPLLLLLVGLTILYRAVPPGVAPTGAAVAGAAVATVLLRTAEFAFTEVIRSSSGWQTIYGPLASLALLLTWGLAASAAVILGAEVVILLVRPERLAKLGEGQPGDENRSPQERDRDAG